MKKISKKQMLILSLLPGGLTLTRLFSMSPDLIEKHYSQGLYHLLARALGYISQCLPLSLAEVLVSMAVLGLLGGLIKQGLNISKGTLALKAALKKDALFLVAVFSLGYFLFLLLWGFNYYRSWVLDWEVFWAADGKSNMEIPSRMKSSQHWVSG